YLTNFGTVAYNSPEQGLSATIKDAIERNHMKSCKRSFMLLDREPLDDMIKRMKRHKRPQCLSEDSAQYTRINRTQYYELKELMQSKNKGIVWVSQAKGKEPKGALADDIRFDVDLKLWVDGFKMFPEGRMNGGGDPYPIWHEGTARRWSEIK